MIAIELVVHRTSAALYGNGSVASSHQCKGAHQIIGIGVSGHSNSSLRM